MFRQRKQCINICGDKLILGQKTITVFTVLSSKTNCVKRLKSGDYRISYWNHEKLYKTCNLIPSCFSMYDSIKWQYNLTEGYKKEWMALFILFYFEYTS